ncbi:MAG: AI-2E family transporter [Methylococcaceae bacterium]|nr:AI-2E family transporter [Methylococcaceae bacterium]
MVTASKKGLNYFLGDAHILYFLVAGDTTQAVFYGVVLAAFGQGFTARIGYYIADVKMSLLLAILTTLLALIPMGTMLIWLPTALMLIINNQLFTGFVLLL